MNGGGAGSGAIARLLVGLLAPIVILLSTAQYASAQTLTHIRDTGVLRVGYRRDAQPFSYQDGGAARVTPWCSVRIQIVLR
jgi:ABC-type amino acid transport substrate-binding protein